MDRHAIVTGSSSGFGYAICLRLAQEGFYVYATMRNIAKGKDLIEEAEQLHVKQYITVKELDVTSEASLAAFREELAQIDGVDVLVNNAGYAGGGFVEDCELADFKQQFDTNVFGAIALTNLVLPIMRQNRKGTIINISSISGKIGFPGLSPYSSSKFALEGFSESLRLEMKPFGVYVVLIEPGSYNTNIWTKGKRVAKREKSAYLKQMERIEKHIEGGKDRLGDRGEIADLVAKIANHRSPSLRYAIGKGVKMSLFAKTILPWKWWEKIILKQLK